MSTEELLQTISTQMASVLYYQQTIIQVVSLMCGIVTAGFIAMIIKGWFK